MDQFDAQYESKKIVSFLKTIVKKTQKRKVVINWSGGVDSTVSLYLLAQSMPVEAITILHLPYKKTFEDDFLPIFGDLHLKKEQFVVRSIIMPVSSIQKQLKITDAGRLGNVMARVRMIVAFDTAKKLNALVCGTENRTEHLLGYYTRFGDGASDIEPIHHLYKTHVYKLAEYLKVPKSIRDASPSAGLWNGQTDEGEFGFSYKEADEVLFRAIDENQTVLQLEKKGFPNARKILEFARKNAFKSEVPYTM